MRKIGGNVYRVWVDLTNPKVTPTIAIYAAHNKLVRPDLITLKGNVEFIFASWKNNSKTFDYLDPITAMIDQHDLGRIIYALANQEKQIVESNISEKNQVTLR